MSATTSSSASAGGACWQIRTSQLENASPSVSSTLWTDQQHVFAVSPYASHLLTKENNHGSGGMERLLLRALADKQAVAGRAPPETPVTVVYDVPPPCPQHRHYHDDGEEEEFELPSPSTSSSFRHYKIWDAAFDESDESRVSVILQNSITFQLYWAEARLDPDPQTTAIHWRREPQPLPHQCGGGHWVRMVSADNGERVLVSLPASLRQSAAPSQNLVHVMPLQRLSSSCATASSSSSSSSNGHYHRAHSEHSDDDTTAPRVVSLSLLTHRLSQSQSVSAAALYRAHIYCFSATTPHSIVLIPLVGSRRGVCRLLATHGQLPAPPALVKAVEVLDDCFLVLIRQPDFTTALYRLDISSLTWSAVQLTPAPSTFERMFLTRSRHAPNQAILQVQASRQPAQLYRLTFDEPKSHLPHRLQYQRSVANSECSIDSGDSIPTTANERRKLGDWWLEVMAESGVDVDLVSGSAAQGPLLQPTVSSSHSTVKTDQQHTAAPSEQPPSVLEQVRQAKEWGFSDDVVLAAFAARSSVPHDLSPFESCNALLDALHEQAAIEQEGGSGERHELSRTVSLGRHHHRSYRHKSTDDARNNAQTIRRLIQAFDNDQRRQSDTAKQALHALKEELLAAKETTLEWRTRFEGCDREMKEARRQLAKLERTQQDLTVEKERAKELELRLETVEKSAFDARRELELDKERVETRVMMLEERLKSAEQRALRDERLRLQLADGEKERKQLLQQISELRLELDEQESTLAVQNARLESVGQCVICLDDIPRVVLLPCSHACVCVKCSESLLQQSGANSPAHCPVCRADVQIKLPIFL